MTVVCRVRTWSFHYMYTVPTVNAMKTPHSLLWVFDLKFMLKLCCDNISFTLFPVQEKLSVKIVWFYDYFFEEKWSVKTNFPILASFEVSRGSMVAEIGTCLKSSYKTKRTSYSSSSCLGEHVRPNLNIFLNKHLYNNLYISAHV